jgi:hypothetical protein
MAPCAQRTKHVAALVNEHHHRPGETDKAGDQNDLIEALMRRQAVALTASLMDGL